MIETAKFFYPHHRWHLPTDSTQTFLTNVKNPLFRQFISHQIPTVVGVGRELVGSWWGVDWEFTVVELGVNNYFFCLRMEKVSYLCILNWYNNIIAKTDKKI
ncbi:MAG: hypothetical protein IJ634_03135 [Bacteroidales bacterium]|nr:hypothetical protein [Bacteroidales bacterium]